MEQQKQGKQSRSRNTTRDAERMAMVAARHREAAEANRSAADAWTNSSRIAQDSLDVITGWRARCKEQGRQDWSLDPTGPAFEKANEAAIEARMQTALARLATRAIGPEELKRMADAASHDSDFAVQQADEYEAPGADIDVALKHGELAKRHQHMADAAHNRAMAILRELEKRAR